MEWDQKVMRSGRLTTKTEICVVGALLTHFNTEGEAWPSMESIAKMALCNRNNATTAVKRLVALRFLIEYPPGRNGRKTKTYKMALPPDLAKSNVVHLQTFIRPKRQG